MNYLFSRTSIRLFCSIIYKVSSSIFCICSFSNHHCKSWFIWSFRVCNRAAHKRNWHPQSTGCFRKKCIAACFKRIFIAGNYSIYYFNTGYLVGYACMVTGFRIQDQYKHVDIRYSRYCSYYYCFSNNKFPGNKSGDCKSGKKFEN